VFGAVVELSLVSSVLRQVTGVEVICF